jgi:hypothetical protein
LVAEGLFTLKDTVGTYNSIYNFEKGKIYIISLGEGFNPLNLIGYCNHNNTLVTQLVYDSNYSDSMFIFQDGNVLWIYNGEEDYLPYYDQAYFEVYEIPLGESAQVEKHNKTINALMQRVSDLEQKAGLTSVGYVQDSTLNLIRVNVVDDVLEVSGFKFDGEVMII